MTDKEYQDKKRECWEEYTDMIHRNLAARYVFDKIFDRAFALGKQEKDSDTVIQGWVARDDGERWHERELHLFTRNKPERRKLMGDWMGRPSMMLDHSLFPDITWSDEPQEVEIIIK